MICVRGSPLRSMIYKLLSASEVSHQDLNTFIILASPTELLFIVSQERWIDVSFYKTAFVFCFRRCQDTACDSASSPLPDGESLDESFKAFTSWKVFSWKKSSTLPAGKSLDEKERNTGSGGAQYHEQRLLSIFEMREKRCGPVCNTSKHPVSWSGFIYQLGRRWRFCAIQCNGIERGILVQCARTHQADTTMQPQRRLM